MEQKKNQVESAFHPLPHGRGLHGSSVNIYYLISGIAVIVKENEDDETWEYPMMFQYQINPQGRVEIAFHPLFLFFKNPKVKPKNLNSIVLFKEEAEEKMKERYLSVVNHIKASVAGIVIPEPQIEIKPKGGRNN